MSMHIAQCTFACTSFPKSLDYVSYYLTGCVGCLFIGRYWLVVVFVIGCSLVLVVVVAICWCFLLLVVVCCYWLLVAT